jgi:hypothetical protein
VALAVAAQGTAAKLTVEPFPMDATGHVVFTGVVEVPGVTAADLYNRVLLWSRTFQQRDGIRNFFRLNDPVLGRMVCATSLSWTGSVATTTIEVKDGKYRWTIDNFLISGDQGKTWPYENLLTKDGIGKDKGWRQNHCEMDRRAVLAFLADFQAAMSVAPKAW